MFWFVQGWKRALDFSGRSSRRAFWWFQLYNLLFALLAFAIALEGVRIGGLIANTVTGALQLAGFVSTVPSTAICIRRLHDIGKSGWYFLWGLVPYVGQLVMLWFYTRPGEPTGNAYGDPE